MSLVVLTIKLNKNEYNYLCQAVFLEDKYRKLLFSSVRENYDKYSIQVSEDQADAIRDLCGEQLQRVGFDKKYELTSEGRILESLVDKFFII